MGCFAGRSGPTSRITISTFQKGPMTVFLKCLLEDYLNASLVPMQETMYVKYVHIRCAASPNHLF
jgi:hypothetical protein